MKRFLFISFLGIMQLFALQIYAKNQKEILVDVRFEHLRLNVADKNKTAQWYVENVGLEIIPSNNNDVVYVADKDHNFMFEFTSIPNIKNSYFDIKVDAFHIAFEGHKTIEDVAEKMLENGAKQEGIIYRNQIGDFVLNVRDINGFVIQLIHRVNPFFDKPVKSAIRFEHFAFNTSDQMVTALWFVEFLNLDIPWSKDIDTTANNYRNYRVPFVGDRSQHMSFELYNKETVDRSFSKMNHEICHIAFASNNIEKLAKRMAYGGAKQIGNIQREINGDQIVDLVDPRGFPIRLIERKISILK